MLKSSKKNNHRYTPKAVGRHLSNQLQCYVPTTVIFLGLFPSVCVSCAPHLHVPHTKCPRILQLGRCTTTDDRTKNTSAKWETASRPAYKWLHTSYYVCKAQPVRYRALLWWSCRPLSIRDTCIVTCCTAVYNYLGLFSCILRIRHAVYYGSVRYICIVPVISEERNAPAYGTTV